MERMSGRHVLLMFTHVSVQYQNINQFGYQIIQMVFEYVRERFMECYQHISTFAVMAAQMRI